jgi:hypothetical protein
MDISALTPKDSIEIVTPSGQAVTLRWLSAAGLDSLARAARRKPPAFDFMTEILHAHLVDPAMTLVQLREWRRDDLDAIAKGWAAHDLGLDTELSDGDVAAAFLAAAEQYANEQARQLSRMLGGAFETIRRENEAWARTLMGPAQGITQAIESFRRSQEHWHNTLGFTEMARAVQEQQRLASSLSSLRLVEEMQRAARASLASVVISDLAGTTRSLEVALGYRANILGAMQFAESRELAVRLDRGLDSLTRFAEAVWRTWGGPSGAELTNTLPVLHQAPAIEVYSASAAAAGLVAEAPTEHPSLVLERQDQVTTALPTMLASVSQALVPMHQAATSLIESEGADSARHFSVSLRELLSHILRMLAPDEAIAQWPSKVPEDFSQGRPTRRGRLRYILRAVANTAYEPFVASDMRQVLELINALHAGTHSLDSQSDPVTRRLILRRVEFFVTLIVDAHRMAQR